jgi:hypothetical protein
MAALAAANAVADSVEDMCRDMKRTEQVCQCGAERLKAAVGDEDYVVYEAIGADYRTNQGNGMDRSDAWDDAVKNESVQLGVSFPTLLKRTNKLGAAHNKAIKDCSS